MLAGSGIDTLDPKRTEVAFLGFTVAVRVTQTFLIGILGYGPDVLPCEEVCLRIFLRRALEATEFTDLGILHFLILRMSALPPYGRLLLLGHSVKQ